MWCRSWKYVYLDEWKVLQYLYTCWFSAWISCDWSCLSCCGYCLWLVVSRLLVCWNFVHCFHPRVIWKSRRWPCNVSRILILMFLSSNWTISQRKQQKDPVCESNGEIDYWRVTRCFNKFRKVVPEPRRSGLKYWFRSGACNHRCKSPSIIGREKGEFGISQYKAKQNIWLVGFFV